MWSLAEKLEFKKALEERTSAFAVASFKCLDLLPRINSSKVIAFQLGKSASSIGANYREANRAESVEDFTHKIGIALKEAAESLYWIGLLKRMYPDCADVDSLACECDELVRLFQTIRTKMSNKKDVAK